jgi:hypothetical protein
MKWIKVEDQLPRDRQAVLVRRNEVNWLCDHTLADGSKQSIWRWQACIFRVGKTKEEVKASGICGGFDQDGNNHTPYGWDMFGPGSLFGQEVSHWCAIEDVLEFEPELEEDLSSRIVSTPMGDEPFDQALKWHLPTMLEWLRHNRHARTMPDGSLIGEMLRVAAERIDSLSRKVNEKHSGI